MITNNSNSSNHTSESNEFLEYLVKNDWLLKFVICVVPLLVASLIDIKKSMKDKFSALGDKLSVLVYSKILGFKKVYLMRENMKEQKYISMYFEDLFLDEHSLAWSVGAIVFYFIVVIIVCLFILKTLIEEVTSDHCKFDFYCFKSEWFPFTWEMNKFWTNGIKKFDLCSNATKDYEPVVNVTLRCRRFYVESFDSLEDKMQNLYGTLKVLTSLFLITFFIVKILLTIMFRIMKSFKISINFNSEDISNFKLVMLGIVTFIISLIWMVSLFMFFLVDMTIENLYTIFALNVAVFSLIFVLQAEKEKQKNFLPSDFDDGTVNLPLYYRSNKLKISNQSDLELIVNNDDDQ